jgi:hypothetical protein
VCSTRPASIVLDDYLWQAMRCVLSKELFLHALKPASAIPSHADFSNGLRSKGGLINNGGDSMFNSVACNSQTFFPQLNAADDFATERGDRGLKFSGPVCCLDAEPKQLSSEEA